MGSSFEYVYRKGDIEAKQAYREAVDEASYEDGHSPYSGTIATSSGFYILQAPPMSYSAAIKVADKEADNMSKWQEWVAIEICASEIKEKDFTVTLNATEIGDAVSWDIEALILAKARTKAPAGWTATNAQVTAWERTTGAPRVEATPKVKSTWVVTINLKEHFFASRPQAVAFARERAVALTPTEKTRWKSMSSPNVQISREWRTVDNEHATTNVVVPTKRIKATVHVKLERPKGRGRSGWLFAGWAAS